MNNEIDPDEQPGKKYRPSSGTEGDMFFSCWCCKCARDKAMREGCDFDECDDNELCPIIANTQCYCVTDDQYPSEWTYDKNGQPCCTAFVTAGDPVPSPRCELTIDMFSASEGTT
jgi:hypothetical protein